MDDYNNKQNRELNGFDKVTNEKRLHRNAGRRILHKEPRGHNSG